VLRLIDASISEGSTTVETGAGISTVLFALRGARHTCVVPDPAEADRIRDYCDARGIAHAGVEFVLDQSARVLPRLALHDVDLALIDGCHGFPSPMIDWYYLAPMLRAGGLVVIDDTNIWTCDLLRRFLLADDEWSLERDFPLRAAAFRKTRAFTESREWLSQPFVVERSHVPPRSLAAFLLRSGRFGELARHVARRLRRH